ncbi:DinB family protein [Nocardioides marmoriginsengisoli]|uniref:DinB family protein n=1 Tax=Nocardioides marmoriginsengisoli TaxID=661483 RepID=UPI001C82CF26|nr:DinB family protein [Nocardioides marmoriginsengisoli]
MAIEPDTKDWTWVLERPCPECGFDPSAIDATTLPDLIRSNTRGWYGVLDGADAAVRPGPQTWSRLEYACHVRDVHRLFGERVGLMLDQDDPQFANWDQDVTAIEDRYDEQDPSVVAVELVEAAADVAAVYAGVASDAWQRTGRRSNGSLFTVETLGIYHLHDVVHHLYDIGGSPDSGPDAESAT